MAYYENCWHLYLFRVYFYIKRFIVYQSHNSMEQVSLKGAAFACLDISVLWILLELKTYELRNKKYISFSRDMLSELEQPKSCLHTSIKSSGYRQSGCLTPLFTLKTSVCPGPTVTQLSPPSYISLIIITIFTGIPLSFSMFQMDVRCTQSNAFFKTIKFKTYDFWSSSHCLIMSLNAYIWFLKTKFSI